MMGGAKVAGVHVTPENAIGASTVFACVRLISETIASLPLVLYRTSGKTKDKATDHPAYWLVHNEPNPAMSSFQWREVEQARLLLYGNSYSELDVSGRQDVKEIWPLQPNTVTSEIKDRKKWHKARLNNGSTAVIDDDKILHIPGFGINGLTGLSPVMTNKGAIGLSIAAERFGESLFRNGVRTSGALKHPGRLSPEAHNNLKQSFSDNYSGVDNANKPMVLAEGMDWVQLGMNPGDAQILETRKFQVYEVARLFNVPPHMIAALERSTNNNIEQQSLEFVITCVRSWAIRWESELNRKLLKHSERQSHFFKFLLDGLLRGDTKSRFEAYNLGRNMGIYSTNEIREKEDLNPVDHGDDDYILPLNVGLANAVEQKPNEPAPNA
jgi:HK97 family phage portal protein